MRLLLLPLLAFLIGACQTNTDKKPESPETDSLFKEADAMGKDTLLSEASVLREKDILATWLKDPCSREKEYEFYSLYEKQSEIKSDQDEKLMLMDSLKARGFKVVKWGRGNWMEGPRIVCFTLQKEDCVCHVDKLYYSPGKDSLMTVTERIRLGEN